MKIRFKILFGFLLVIIPIAFIGIFTVVDLLKVSSNLDFAVNKQAEEIDRYARLNNDAQLIKYYDEVLTQSARNYTYTADRKWKERYEENSFLLDAKIKEALSLGDELDRHLFESIESSNEVLVKMEQEAIELADNGNKLAAQKILDSDEYLEEKEKYQNSLLNYSGERGDKYSEVQSIKTGALRSELGKINKSIRIGLYWEIGTVLFVIILAVLAGIVTANSVSKPIQVLTSTTKRIAEGDVNIRADIKTKDETKELADSFNIMVDKLKESQNQIEKKVQDRTQDLEKLNKAMIGRELKMIELKKEIALLKNNK